MDPATALLLWRLINAVKRMGQHLLAPISIRREGMARADVRAYAATRDAQTRHDIQAIRRGEARLQADGTLLWLTAPQRPVAPPPATAVTSESGPLMGDVYDLRKLLSAATEARAVEELERHLNLRATVRKAEEVAEAATDVQKQEAAAETTQPSDDWLSNWRAGAEKVTDEQVQSLWARLLVEEVAAPGSISLRTIFVLQQMGHREATKFAAICPFTVDGASIPRLTDFFSSRGISFANILDLGDLGLLSGTDSMGLSVDVTWPVGDNPANPQTVLLIGDDRALRIHARPNQTQTTFNAYRLTPSGIQLRKLGRFPPDDEFARQFATLLKRQGAVRVELLVGHQVGDQFTHSSAVDL